MQLNPELLSWAQHHHDLVTIDNWVGAGRSRRSWFRSIESGVLIEAQRGVARLPDAPITPAQTIAAAVWSIGSGVLASHRSAAWLWRAAPVGDSPVEVISISRARRTAAAGVVLHRPRDLVDLRPTIRRGIATCNPLRCLVDLGAVDAALVAPALEAMLIAGLVSVRSVDAAVARHRAPGRRGIAALTNAIAELPLGPHAPDSVLETKMAELLRAAGIGGWRFHLRIAGHEVDFALPDVGIVIEVDGWATHGARSQFEHDRRRDADLVVAGWVVLRFTWLQVTRRPAWVAGRIAAAVEARSTLPAPMSGRGQ